VDGGATCDVAGRAAAPDGGAEELQAAVTITATTATTAFWKCCGSPTGLIAHANPGATGDRHPFWSRFGRPGPAEQ
jgi:hypothetical protein